MVEPPPPPQDVIAPVTSAPADTFTRSFVLLSLKRAFRLHIQTDEVLPAERAHLSRQAWHIQNPEHQAFLAWRRSVLLLVAMMFVPLTVSRFFETFDGPDVPHVGRVFKLLPAIAEALFCIVAFDQLKNWANWKKQRRILMIAWAIYFIAPFIVWAADWPCTAGCSVTRSFAKPASARFVSRSATAPASVATTTSQFV